MASVWLVLWPGSLTSLMCEPLAMLLPATPFCCLPLFIVGSGLLETWVVSRLVSDSPAFDNVSWRAGTLTGVLALGGDGLLTLVAESLGDNGGGLLTRNIPLPGSRAGTELALLDSPSVSDCSQRAKRGHIRMCANTKSYYQFV